MIIAEQALHGYANGHQMLASSCEWSLDERKKMDVLSDLNGSCDEDEMCSYYTGYPLNDGEKYVISKTWYASEMSRPGCVWTHSIILDTKDICKIQNISELLMAFHRPAINEYKIYTEKIHLSEGEYSIVDVKEEMLEYLIYTIFGFNHPRLVYFDYGIDIIKELLHCIQIMPSQLLYSYSFSTMSYEVRRYNNNLFSYQVTTKKLAESMKRREHELEICVPFSAVKKMPYWVKNFYEYSKKNIISEISSFIMIYGNNFFNWNTYNGFIRIYFLLKNKSDLKLNEYFQFLLQVMNEYGKNLLQETTNLLIDGKFSIYYFENVEFQVLEMLDMGWFKLSKNQEKELIKKIMCGKIDNLYPLLCKYKEGKLKHNAKRIIEDVVLKLEPKDFKRVSNMNEDICVVLVHMNPRLLLSEDIWTAERAFQIMLLYSAGTWNDLQGIKDLLQLIISKDKEDISNECYSVYGDLVFQSVLEIMKVQRTVEKNTLKYWYQVMLKKPIDLINALSSFESSELSRDLFMQIDKHDKQLVNSVNANVWEGIYEKIVETEEKHELRVKLCLDYILIIFLSNQRLSTRIVQSVVRPVYERMLSNSINLDEWNYFQYLLPLLEPCNSWDKCLRMREALNMKGYKIDGIN